MTLPQTKDTADLVADLIRARIEKERRALSRRVAWGVLEGRAIIAALEDLLAEAEALA